MDVKEVEITLTPNFRLIFFHQLVFFEEGDDLISLLICFSSKMSEMFVSLDNCKEVFRKKSI